MHDLLAFDGQEGVRASMPGPLENFCRTIGQMAADLPVSEIPGCIASGLPSVLGRSDLLTSDQRQSPADAYCRHPMFICPGDRFSLMAVVWPPGIYSPIHDHSEWCAYGVYEGTVEETIYEATGVENGEAIARPIAVNLRRPSDTAHMPAAATHIHCMHNPGSTSAISLHVYGGNCEKSGPNVDTVYTARS